MRRNQESGFTLIEAVVSSAVFAFVVVSVLGVYTATLRLDSKTRAERAVQENARFIMEYFAKLVRNGSIDYASYPGDNASNTTTDLWVLNQANELEHVYLEGTDLKLEKSSTTNLNSSGVKITKAQLLVSPSLNPLTSAKLSNQQPSLTIFLEITSNYGEKPGDISVLNIQSTFASREYPSRE
jgi:Tfp pilus assembly protein PilE